MLSIVDGRAIARDIHTHIAERIAQLPRTPRVDIIVVGDDAATAAFVRAKKRVAQKVGIEFVEHDLDTTITTEEIIEKIGYIAEKTDGIVVQLPLPESVDAHAVTRAIPASRDIDVLNDDTFELFLQDKAAFVPPVAGAVAAVLDTHNVDVSDMQTVVVGKGKLVGVPVKAMLEKRGAHVTVLDRSSGEDAFASALAKADVVVSGAGVPNLVQPEMLREGVVLIDAGTSGTGQTVVGDIAHTCTQVASVFAQTPGGIGPITIAVLFKNLADSIDAHL